MQNPMVSSGASAPRPPSPSYPTPNPLSTLPHFHLVIALLSPSTPSNPLSKDLSINYHTRLQRGDVCLVRDIWGYLVDHEMIGWTGVGHDNGKRDFKKGKGVQNNLKTRIDSSSGEESNYRILSPNPPPKKHQKQPHSSSYYASDHDHDYRLSPISIDWIDDPTLQQAASQIAGQGLEYVRIVSEDNERGGDEDVNDIQDEQVGVEDDMRDDRTGEANNEREEQQQQVLVPAQIGAGLQTGNGYTNPSDEEDLYSSSSLPSHTPQLQPSNPSTSLTSPPPTTNLANPNPTITTTGPLTGGKRPLTRSGTTELPHGIIHLFRERTDIPTSSSFSSQYQQQQSYADTVSRSQPNSDQNQNQSKNKGKKDSIQSPSPQSTSTTGSRFLSVLALPSYMTPSDFLIFIARTVESGGLERVRVLRDASPNRSLVLLKFRDPRDAAEFMRTYNGKPFGRANDSEICHVVPIRSVKIRTSPIPPYTTTVPLNSPTAPASLSSIASKDPSKKSTSRSTVTQISAGATHDQVNGYGNWLESDIYDERLYELPTCPICLERMDSSVTGLVTVICRHAAGCGCLDKWGGGSCPVCINSQLLHPRSDFNSHRHAHRRSLSRPTLSPTASSTTVVPAAPTCASLGLSCSTCSSVENLWICLICGHVGCGRYEKKHAWEHYSNGGGTWVPAPSLGNQSPVKKSGKEADLSMKGRRDSNLDETKEGRGGGRHGFAMELQTGRVWDYGGDGYVHRLIRNKADGKLVELPSSFGSGPPQYSSSTFADSLTTGMATTSSTTVDDRVGPGRVTAANQEKIEAIGLEYSYLLTSQLESQRAFYDGKMKESDGKIWKLEKRLEDAKKWGEGIKTEKEALEAKIRDLEMELKEGETVEGLKKAQDKNEKKISKLMEDKRKVENERDTANSFNEAYLKKLKAFRDEKVQFESEKKEMMGEIGELKEQVRDLMIAIEMREKIELAEKEAKQPSHDDGHGMGDARTNSGSGAEMPSNAAGLEELAGGSLSLPPPSASGGSKSKKKKKR